MVLPALPSGSSYLDPPPLTASIAADLICAGLNNNLLAEELSPGLTDLEHQLCGWFCQRLGLPEQSGGVLASGGTLSNLMGLVVARTHAGVRDGVVLCSRDAHVSLQKAATVMGLADDASQLPVNSDGGLNLAALDAAMVDLRRDGRCCLCVARAPQSAVDPLNGIASLCRREGLAACGCSDRWGFALWEPLAPLMQGLHQADSVTLNPQKLLGITKTSSMLPLRDRSKLRQAFSTGLPYMESSPVTIMVVVGLQGTRPAEVLKLWLACVSSASTASGPCWSPPSSAKPC